MIVESEIWSSKSACVWRLCRLVSLVAKLEEDWVDVLFVEVFQGPIIKVLGSGPIELGSGHVELGTVRDSAK
jgi:hypothetical protein